MKWQFWRRNSQPGEQVVPEDRWHDTPETFPVEEVFRQSCFNWKPLLLGTIASLVLNFLLARKVVEIASKNAMYLNRYFEVASKNPSIINKLSYHHISSMPYFLVSAGIDFLSLIFVFLYFKKETNRRMEQHNRLQTFVDYNGVTAIPQLLNILQLRISASNGNMSALTETLAYNLELLLSQVDTETKLILTTEQIDLLYTLVDEESIYNRKLNSLQLRTLELFRLILAPSVIEKIYLIAGSNCANVLEKAYHDTHSERIRYLITNQFAIIDYTNQKYEKHTIHINVKNKLEHVNKKRYSNKWYKSINVKLLCRKFSFPLFIILPGLIAVLFSGSNFLAQGIIQLSLSAPCLIFIVIYSQLYFQVPRVESNDQYSQESVIEHLSVFSNYHSFFIKNLIIFTILENVEISSIHPLNSTGLDELHKIICPPKLYKSQISALYKIPLPDVGAIPAILRGLVFLGNKSSVKVIEEFCKTTENEEHKRVALGCLDALNARLTEKPEQLLRASTLPGDALLRASQPSITADKLLKPMVAEEHIVFPQTEELDELEVNRQKL